MGKLSFSKIFPFTTWQLQKYPVGYEQPLVRNEWLTSSLVYASLSLGGPNGNSGSGRAMLDYTKLNHTIPHGRLAKREKRSDSSYNVSMSWRYEENLNKYSLLVSGSLHPDV